MGGQLRIVTDSTCDLPPELVERYGIIVVPALIHFGHETYLDGVEITHQEMYRCMLEDDEVPKSSQPSPGQFLEVYEELAAQGYLHPRHRLPIQSLSVDQDQRTPGGGIAPLA